MQSSGQYGVTEVPQFVVGGSQQHPSQAHIFSLAHDHMSLSPPTSGHGHHHPGQQQHLYSHHQQQQVVAPKEPQQSLHHLHAHQQSQASSHSPHQQRQQHQHMQQQQQQHHHHHHQQQQTSVQHQHQMVHQLGLGGGGPDSPEAAAASPSPPVASSRPSPPTNTGFAKQMLSAAAGMSLQAQQLGHEAAAADDDGNMELGEEGRSTGGGGGNRWPRQETLLLIQIRSEMDSNFRDSGLKGPLWEDVARKLAELGYHRSAKKCKEKFENIHKYYKKTKDGKAGRQDGKNYRFFSELDALYSGRRNNVVGASTRDADHATAATTLLLPAGGGRGLDHMGAPSAFRAAAAAAEEENNNVAAVSDSSEENHNEAEGGDEEDEDEDEDDNTTRSKKRFKRSSKDSDHGDLHARTSSSSSKKKVMLLESLVKKLMDKQEAMQRKFLESMEKREHDRIAREEAWKRQEMERMTREHELRIQQHTLAATRDAALIAVLQKVTGQTLQLPRIPEPHPLHPSSPPSPPPLPVQQQQQQQQHTTTAIQPRNHRIQQQLQHPQDVEPGDGKDGFDLHSKRWPTPEVHALIRLRMEMESRFQETGAKGPLWEEISRGMSSMGYSFRNAKRCKEKWENVNKYYRKTKESNKKRAENSKTCPYFHQLEALYHNAGSLHGGNKLPPRASSKVAHEGAQSQDVALQLPPAAAGLQQDHRDHHDQSCSREALVQDSVNTEVMQLPASAAGAADGSGSASNGAATAHLFSSPENGSSGDPGGSGISITKKALQGRTSR